ncbi:hypothetical protein I4U23_028353 [Adineta vaga]|nr:hypothetical protein I4U23_028353 [Adineta vaga]
MQRPPSPVLIANTFRDSNEIINKRELVQPSAPTGERMDLNSTSHRSIIQSVEDDHNSSSLHQITNRPLMRSIIRPNDNDDEDNISNQDQIHDERKNNDNNIVLEASGYDQSRLADLSADEAYARQLQQEEYSRDSLASHRHPYDPFRVESDDESGTVSAPTYIPDDDHSNLRADAGYAAYLQRQEQVSRYFRQNPPFVQRQQSHRSSNEPSQTNEDENEPVPPPFSSLFQYRQPSHNEDDNDEENPYVNMPHPFFQLFVNRGRPAPDDFHAFFSGLHGRRHRRSGNLQDTEEDFGPEDYERLLQLDDTVRKKKLTKEQINSIPIESFRRTSNNTDEENKCGICLEQFETNQTLRRFSCRHIYHKECGDRWLQENNACPICREPPVKVQSMPSSRHTRHTNHHHNNNSNTNSTRRSTNSNRNPMQPRTTHFRRGGSSQRPS